MFKGFSQTLLRATTDILDENNSLLRATTDLHRRNMSFRLLYKLYCPDLIIQINFKAVFRKLDLPQILRFMIPAEN